MTVITGISDGSHGHSHGACIITRPGARRAGAGGGIGRMPNMILIDKLLFHRWHFVPPLTGTAVAVPVRQPPTSGLTGHGMF